jgi:hypothetical protein
MNCSGCLRYKFLTSVAIIITVFWDLPHVIWYKFTVVSKQLVASIVKVPSQKTLFFTKIVMLNELLWSFVNEMVVT